MLPATAWSRVGPPPLPDATETAEPAASDAAEDEQPDEETRSPTASTQDGPGDADPMLDSLIEEATRHFTEGRRLFLQGEYDDAAAEFERSYAAIRSGETLRNVVLSHSQAGDPIAAVRAARRYLELAPCGQKGADPLDCAKPVTREEIELTLERQLRKVGELRLVVEPGVEIREVRVSGRVVPIEDFPIVLDPGEIDVEVFGLDADERQFSIVRLRAGKQSSLYVPPFDQPAEEDPRTRLPDPDPRERLAELERLERRKRALRTSFWAGLGFTVAAGASVGILGGLTVQAKNDFESGQDDTEDMMGPPESTANRFYNLRNATNAMVAVTAVVGMTTVVLGLFAFTRAKDPGSRASTHKRLRLTPGGVSVRF